ncbi:TM0106 family RecB-like putative nuclease [Phytoactinopolyspora halotolerans]|uniref:TM0106 family RecB-like putative nuclease n=1 Tax=Phytoactinopolyspora halotolerans TaxID=1981512 RepID=A0A6L9S1M5_9ACTN|nr:TM0106 family RecB-like putative nuclease [Phytoactinopolyspora halotolerans]NED98553.1 TM0106 family RecB-like putative nuclease [Phytoactinopolyspora halotolerans]
MLDLVKGVVAMYLAGTEHLVLSPTDLVAHLECPHLTTLNRDVAEGRRPRPHNDDASAQVVRTRGDAHEAAVLAEMSAAHRVVEIPRGSGPAEAEELTVAAMKDGADRIFQATFYDGRWRGHADFLIRNDARPSHLGAWSYDIADTKLAKHVKASALLQMAVYAQRLEQLQGVPPETLTVILGTSESVSVPYVDVAAYTRHAMREFETWLADPPDTYPVRIAHCAICPWADTCEEQWRADDDLVLVPFLRRDQRDAFHDAGVTTVEELAATDDDALAAITGIGAATRRRLAAQARLQVGARAQQVPPYDLITPPEPGRGLAMLPEPDDGDLFLDLEGDPFFGDHGIEYLWGISDARDAFTAWWAHDADAERRAFEHVVDHIMQTWEQHPGMHVYHYAPYEPSRLKTLSQRYSTRVDEVDALLRGERLVDLYAVVRQGLRIGTESYSIKALEQFYDPDARTGASVKDAGSSIVEYERWLIERDQSILDAIEAYNRDDCVSTRRLRDWLEQRRDELIAVTGPMLRPGDLGTGPEQHLAERDPELEAIEARLLDGVPDDPDARTATQQASVLLVNLLEWHRRENRAEWWEYFRTRMLSLDELVEDPATIGGLHSPELVRTEKRSGVWRYQMPPQECRMRIGEQVEHADADGGTSTVVRLDPDLGQIELKRSLDRKDAHPDGLLPSGPVPTKTLEKALRRVGIWVAEQGIEADGPYRGIRDLLLGLPPRLPDDVPLRLVSATATAATTTGTAVATATGSRPGPGPEPGADALCRAAPALTGALPVQGPPGAGKTYAGSHAIIQLLRSGKTVGITALSHRAITNLLDAVMAADSTARPVVRAAQKADESNGSRHDRVTVVASNDEIEASLADGSINLVAGTAWLFAREKVRVDALVVDEAGQFSLANTVAAAAAADSLILLGDPRQLAQPSKGIHPEGAGVSALEHVLGEHDTVPPDRGLFLDVTWRMHPAVCAPISELSYDGLLHARGGLENQVVGVDVASPEEPVQPHPARPDPAHPAPAPARDTSADTAQLSLFDVGESPDGFLEPAAMAATAADDPLTGAGIRWYPVQHTGCSVRSDAEVDVVEGLVDRLVGRPWIDADGQTSPLGPDDILVVAPYNAQVGQLINRLDGRARVGTVDKFQGQEAPVVIVSLTTSSAEEAPRGIDFVANRNRLNVAVSRARSLAILVGSPALLTAPAAGVGQLQGINTLCRLVEHAPSSMRYEFGAS